MVGYARSVMPFSSTIYLLAVFAKMLLALQPSALTFPYGNDTAFVNYDAKGAFVNCASTDHEHERSVRCHLQPEKTENDPYGLACYVTWFKDYSSGRDRVHKGCWVNQEISLQHQCDVQKCVSRQATKGVNFCCCFGHNCNRLFELAKVTTTLPPTAAANDTASSSELVK
uniref:Uncharacterized protein n=1 Tax=Plectus sambesii TaxID=2011161 RepID=A0A914VHR0_9BILA